MNSSAEALPGSTPTKAPMSQSQATISVQILSPSPEIPSPLLLSSLSPETTVADLKLEIQSRVATRPEPLRQRLIHGGRMLARDLETLRDIFGESAVGINKLRVDKRSDWLA